MGLTEKINNNAHKILASFVFLIVSLNQIVHIFYEGFDAAEFLWFCDLMSFVLAYALWTKNKFLLSTVFLASVPAQFMWIVDFFLSLAGQGFGRTAWMFEDSYMWITPYISTIMHGILIPSALYGIYRFGFGKRAILGVYFIIITLLPITYFFTDPTINRNCVFFPCDLNFVEDREIISSNSLYMSKLYLLKAMFEWFIYTSAFYIATILSIKFYKKLLTKN